MPKKFTESEIRETFKKVPTPVKQKVVQDLVTQDYTQKEIADMFGHEKIYLKDKPGEADITLCDYNLAKEHLGWEPNFNIKDYIKNYLNK